MTILGRLAILLSTLLFVTSAFAAPEIQRTVGARYGFSLARLGVKKTTTIRDEMLSGDMKTVVRRQTTKHVGLLGVKKSTAGSATVSIPVPDTNRSVLEVHTLTFGTGAKMVHYETPQGMRLELTDVMKAKVITSVFAGGRPTP